MVKVTVLGSGASLGVPVVGCDCSVCKSDSPYNKRTRSSILFTKDNKNILVDFGLDVRNQLLSANVKTLECAILTHDHADHVSGIDDLRVFRRERDSALPIYTDAHTADVISDRYRYMMHEDHIEPRKLEDFECRMELAGIDIQFFRQNHRNIDSLGIRIGDFVYSNDVIKYYDESHKYMENVEVLLLDCIDLVSTDAHFGLDDILKVVERYKPKQTYLVNMSHAIDYFEIQKQLPDNIKPSYDGMNFLVKIAD
jgi:phosphoribosyl 1,2-cyclic phosphate phosphodiesterase